MHPAAAKGPADLWQRVNAISQHWSKHHSTDALRERVRRIAPEAALEMRRRFRKNAKSAPNEASAWVFIEFYDAENDRENAILWRDLILLRSAQLGSIVGDYASVAWFFQLLADAHYRDPKIFEKALDILETTGASSCEKTKSQSVCELETGGAALRAVGGVHTGLVLQEAALERLERGRHRDDDHAARLRLNVAVGWWQDGVASRSVAHLSLLDAQLADGKGKLIWGDRAAYHALHAAECEARLDFPCAEHHFDAAVASLEKAKPQGNRLELVYRAGEILDGMTLQFIERTQCLDCPQNLLAPVRRYVLSVSISDVPEMPADAGIALAFLQARPNALTKEQREAILGNERRKVAGVNSANVERWLARIKSREQRAYYAHLLHYLNIMLMVPTKPQADDGLLGQFRSFVEARKVSAADKHVDAMMAGLIEYTYNFGDTRGFLNEVAMTAFLLQSREATAAEHSTLRYLWRFYQANFVNVPNPIGASGRANLATTLAPAFARLAELELASGEPKQARQHLDEVTALLHHKLEREWRFGEERAVAAIRTLRPAIQSAAATLVTLSSVLKDAAAQAARNEAFELAQISALSDTAANLQLTLRDQVVAASGLREEIETRNKLAAEIDIAEAVASEYGTFTPIGARQHRAALEKRLESLSSSAAGLAKVESSLNSQKSVAAADAARRLRKGEKLLAVQSGERGSLVFLIDGSGRVAAHRNAFDRSRLFRSVQEIRKGLTISAKGDYPLFAVRRAHRFFRDFFGPLAGDIKSASAIVAVLSGPIEALPLAVLPTEDDGISTINDDAARVRPISWLARTTAVSRAPSVLTLVALRSGTSDATGATAPAKWTFLGVGDPVLAPTKLASRTTSFSGIVDAQRLADVDWLRSQPSLPETRAELDRLATGFGESLLLVGPRASETVLKETELSKYDVMAFATHGVVAGFAFDGSEPGLVLTPPETASRRDDGFLTMSEIAALNLKAQLVILSACDTATSDGRPMADGLSGLARGFFLAGAHNLVATNWAIPSEPAVELTTLAVKERLQGGAPQWSEALRRAQLALIDSVGPEWFGHPASWGAFQVIGAD